MAPLAWSSSRRPHPRCRVALVPGAGRAPRTPVLDALRLSSLRPSPRCGSPLPPLLLGDSACRAPPGLGASRMGPEPFARLPRVWSILLGCSAPSPSALCFASALILARGDASCVLVHPHYAFVVGSSCRLVPGRSWLLVGRRCRSWSAGRTERVALGRPGRRGSPGRSLVAALPLDAAAPWTPVGSCLARSPVPATATRGG